MWCMTIKVIKYVSCREIIIFLTMFNAYSVPIWGWSLTRAVWDKIEEGDMAKGLDINFQWSFQLILGRKLQRLIESRDKSYKN